MLGLRRSATPAESVLRALSRRGRVARRCRDLRQRGAAAGARQRRPHFRMHGPAL